MRILHTADWHLGAELHGHDRGREQALVISEIVALAVSRRVDALLVAGDVFHSVNPAVRAQKTLYAALSELAEQAPRCAVVLIGGNHDSAARLELPLALRPPGRLTVIGATPRRDGWPDPAACVTPLRGPDDDLAAMCLAVPFLRPGDLQSDRSTDASGDRDGSKNAAEEGARAVAEVYAAAAGAARAQAPGAPIICMGHLHAVGGAVSELSERRVVIGGAEAVPARVFPKDAAYVALGHLHRPQTIADGDAGGPIVRYAGSPLPLSSAERGYPHGVSLVELGPDGRAEVEHVRLNRPVPLLRTPETGAATLDAATAALKALEPPPAAGPDLRPFLEVAVRLDGPEPDLRARIDGALEGKEVRLLRILRETGRQQADPTASSAEDGGEDVAALSPERAFEELHARRYGAPPDTALLRAFRMVLAEAEDAAAEALADATVDAGDRAAEADGDASSTQAASTQAASTQTASTQAASAQAASTPAADETAA